MVVGPAFAEPAPAPAPASAPAPALTAGAGRVAVPTLGAAAFPAPADGADPGAVTSALPAVVASAVADAVAVAACFVVAALAVPGPTVLMLTVGASRASSAVVLSGVGADIARLSGVTRIHRESAGVAPAAEAPTVAEPDRWEPTAVERGGAAGPAGGGQPGEAPGVMASDGGLGAGGRVSAGRGPGRVLVACGVSRFVMVVPPRCAGVPNALRRCAGYARSEGRETDLVGMSLERGSTARGGGFRRTASAAMIGASIVNPR
jgi:hypothetical protein